MLLSIKCDYITKFIEYSKMQQSLDLSSHLLNSSISKQRYSFSKSSRFANNVKPLNDSFYDLPPTTARRSASFGFGNKDMGLRFSKVSPSPEAYNIESGFKKNHRKGFSFGGGREEMETTGAFQDCLGSKYIPGPGMYDSKSTLKKRDISLSCKIEDRSQQHLAKNPGPGTYKYEEFGTPSYYTTSRHISNVNRKISQSPRPNFLSDTISKAQKIGPGQYDHSKTEMNKYGDYFISKIHNSKASSFSRSSRPQPVIQHLLTTPNSTQYQQFSDFGKY